MSAGLLGGKVGVILAGTFATAGTVFALSAYVYTRAEIRYEDTAATAAMGRSVPSSTPARMKAVEALPEAAVSVDWDQVKVIQGSFEPIALTRTRAKRPAVLPRRHRASGARARPSAPPLLASRAEPQARSPAGFRQGVIRPGPSEGIPEWVAFSRSGVERVGGEDDDALPARPRREEVARTMATIRRGVQRCYDLKMVPGEVVIHLTVEGRTGRVIRSRTWDPTSTALCIERLAQRLRFPRFTRERVTIRYAYDLR